MTLLKVTPQIIEDHANAIRATVASLEQHQAEITKIVTNPELQLAGLNDNSMQEAHQSLNAALSTSNTHHIALANNLVLHSNNTTETDAQLARSADYQQA